MAPEPVEVTDPTPAIRIEHLTKQMGNGVIAVDDVSLVVEPGQVLGLVGPNGSGKTVILKILLGLVRPTAGRAFLFGQPVGPGAAVLARVGALVDGPGFVPHLSGRRNLDLAGRQIRLSGGTPDLEAAVAMTGLGEAIDRRYSTYSHGMRYRLAMAQALLGRPDLLLLDEPTTGIDPAQASEVTEAIASSASAGATVVLATHQLAEIERIGTHAAVLRNGRLLASGTVESLIGARPQVHLDIADSADALPAVRAVPGVTRVTVTGSGSITVEGPALRPVEVFEQLRAVGVHVSGFRGPNLEDSYRALLATESPPDRP